MDLTPGLKKRVEQDDYQAAVVVHLRWHKWNGGNRIDGIGDTNPIVVRGWWSDDGQVLAVLDDESGAALQILFEGQAGPNPEISSIDFVLRGFTGLGHAELFPVSPQVRKRLKSEVLRLHNFNWLIFAD